MSSDVPGQPSTDETHQLTPTRPLMGGRLSSLDFVRGVGILGFIYWHSVNYFFVKWSGNSPSTRATLFATGLFILVAGFLLGSRYGTSFQDPARRRKTAYRLISRGGKLLLIFGIAVMLKSVRSPLQGLNDALSLLYARRWDIPLQILAPIAILMITGPVLLAVLGRVGIRTFGILCLIPIAIDSVLPQPLPYFWHYYFVACVGLWFGALTARNWDRCMDLVRNMNAWQYALLVGLYLGVEIAAILSVSSYEYLLNRLAPNLVVILLFFLTWSLPVLRIHDLGGRPVGPIVGLFVTLGRHTLMVYLLQVILLNMIRFSKIVKPAEGIGPSVVVALIVTGLCCLCAYGVAYLGPRGKRIYSAIFE